MLTFNEFVTESSTATVAAIAFAAKISSLNRQITQDRTATKVEKSISSQLFWLASLIAFDIVARGKADDKRLHAV